LGPPFSRDIAFISSRLIAQLSAKTLLSRRIDLQGLDYHLCEGKHVFMLESQGNIPYAQVIEIAAPALGNIADV
jgi:hypothetical protein